MGEKITRVEPAEYLSVVQTSGVVIQDDEVNEAKQGGANSLLGRFLSAIFAPTSTTNGTAAELAQKEYSQGEKDGSVEAVGEQIGLSERGDQVVDSIGEKIMQSKELENVQNETPNESEGNSYVKPNEPETIDKLPNESEYAPFGKIIQSENPSEDSKDLDESGITHNENLNHIDTDSEIAHKRSPDKPGITQDENNAKLENQSDSARGLDGNALEDGDEIIGSPFVGSLKIVHRFGNESKKNIAKKLLKQQARTPSSTGIFDQGAIPPGAEKTLALVLSIILLVSFVILLVVTFQVAFALRVVAFTVTSTHVGKKASIKHSLRSSLRSGIWKLMWFAIFIGFLQELQTQFMAKIFFGEALEKNQIEKLVYRLSVMPFSILAPWKDDLATGMAIMEREYSGREALNKGWNLVKNMAFEAAIIKVIEAVFCGRSFGWMLKKLGGQFFSSFTVTLVQTYFLVLWLIFYFAARCKEDEGGREHFTHQDLEDFLDKLSP
ncbi:hypothetical protein SUGI_1141710 [Cryptomeria japonica]|nr:hypothetical protein SUGI_1141710 [Cryptomeria japonica]